MERMWKKYTEDLPEPRPSRLPTVTEGRVVILTGSTGMLGSYMLARLVSDPQGNGMIQRGLTTDFSKCTFHHVDMTKQDFGLGSRVYDHLLSKADGIFLVAWPVNFNLPFETFEPYVHGIRNVGKFASEDLKCVAAIFISTIDTCSGWDAVKGPVPELRLEDLKLPSTGYGQSKLIASLVLEDVANAGNFPATIVRVGQIAGSEHETHIGVWNRHDDLAQKSRVDWVPAEKMVSFIFEVAGESGYFHGVNPAATTWPELARVIQEFYGQNRMSEVVSFRDWVGRLEESQTDDAQILHSNPSLKLPYLNQSISAAEGQGKFPCISLKRDYIPS
ncbi:ochratoxin A non-ribosomal peptide synthetase [Xylaria bambusicola]|uniref:ochratoxin A non-ribosomal peptide synthetase n=1 Tax=Xylaria bambusicola TaxID=326684 RepID=UPI0020071E07|nr:ochratoxin A non-ribosomal peptide synthetase [Xylaria bambusicola]KAI0506850.1 ochratoxin A non-ribosomal peptide synthetase [Xylaria bambusicola]